MHGLGSASYEAILFEACRRSKAGDRGITVLDLPDIFIGVDRGGEVLITLKGEAAGAAQRFQAAASTLSGGRAATGFAPHIGYRILFTPQ